MKILALSDLHLESGQSPKLEPALVAEAEVIVLAGDIHVGTDGLHWARWRFPDHPIIYVPGNHEYYGHHINKLGLELRRTAKELDICLLDNDMTEIHGVRFIGATLWTDFALFQREHIGSAMLAAKAYLRDFSIITFGTTGWMTPADSVKLHFVSRDYIAKHLAEPHDGPTVVVTHHLPSAECVVERYRGYLTSAAFASRLETLLDKANLWICGHTHDRVMLPGRDEYGRLFCNPHGYPNENPSWSPELAII